MSSADESADVTAVQHDAGPSECGATAVEYALMAAMVALVIVGAVTVFGQNIIPLFVIPASAL